MVRVIKNLAGRVLRTISDDTGEVCRSNGTVEGFSRKYTATEIASHLVYWTVQLGKPVSRLQLMNLLYFAQARHLSQYGKCLFGDKILMAVFGVYIPNVYYETAGWGAMVIDDNRSAVDLSGELGLEVCKMLLDVIEEYAERDVWETAFKIRKLEKCSKTKLIDR